MIAWVGFAGGGLWPRVTAGLLSRESKSKSLFCSTLTACGPNRGLAWFQNKLQRNRVPPACPFWMGRVPTVPTPASASTVCLISGLNAIQI